MNKIKDSISKVCRYIKNGISLLFINKASAKVTDIVRREYYSKLVIAALALFAACGFAVPLLRSLQPLIVCGLAIFAILVYIGFNERDFENGKFRFVYVICIGSHQANHIGKAIYTYHFVGMNSANGNEYNIYLNRTEAAGFEEDGIYCMCFKADNQTPLNNDSLVNYISIQNSAGDDDGGNSINKALTEMRRLALENNEQKDSIQTVPKQMGKTLEFTDIVAQKNGTLKAKKKGTEFADDSNKPGGLD